MTKVFSAIQAYHAGNGSMGAVYLMAQVKPERLPVRSRVFTRLNEHQGRIMSGNACIYASG